MSLSRECRVHFRARGKTSEIALPEDDPAATRVLFSVLHFQNQALPEVANLTVARFRDFAVLCDKYNCCNAVSFVTDAWLEKLLSGARTEDESWILLEAVSFLDKPAAFQSLTKNLVLESVENFLDRKVEMDAYPFPALELHGKLYGVHFPSNMTGNHL